MWGAALVRSGQLFGRLRNVPEKVTAFRRLRQNGRIVADHLAIVNQLPERIPAFPAFFAQRDALFPVEAFHHDTNPMTLGFRSKSGASGMRVKRESKGELTAPSFLDPSHSIWHATTLTAADEPGRHSS